MVDDEKIDAHKHSWIINVKNLQDHVIKESEEERKFGFLPETCCNFPLQLGALISESFSERMISAANLLVDTHRLHLNNEMSDKLIALRTKKKFIDRIRSKNAISAMQFEKIESNKRLNFNPLIIIDVLKLCGRKKHFYYEFCP